MKRLNRKNRKELEYLDKLTKLYEKNPIPKNEILENLFLYLTKKDFSHLIFLNDLYKKIINVHGNIYEFGTRWGRNLSIFTLLRGLYEPYNYTRKIVGFDTFSGFLKTSLNVKDGNDQTIKKGSYSVTKNYEDYLEKILKLKNSELPIEHIKKFDLIKGDAVKKTKQGGMPKFGRFWRDILGIFGGHLDEFWRKVAGHFEEIKRRLEVKHLLKKSIIF